MVKFVLVGEVDVDCEINTDFLKDMFEEYFYYERCMMRQGFSSITVNTKGCIT